MFKKQAPVQPEPINLETIMKRLDNMQHALLWLVEHNSGATGTGRKTEPTNVEPAPVQPRHRTSPATIRQSATKANTFWSDEDMARLIDMDAMGISKKEIAKVLNRTPRAISSRLFILRNNK